MAALGKNMASWDCPDPFAVALAAFAASEHGTEVLPIPTGQLCGPSREFWTRQSTRVMKNKSSKAGAGTAFDFWVKLNTKFKTKKHPACASYRDEHLMDWSKEVYMNVHETRPTKTMPTKSYDRTGFASPFCRALQVGMSLQYWNAWNSDLYGSIASSSMSWDINHTLPTGPISCPRRPFVASKRVHPRHWCGTCCIICCWPNGGWTWCLGSSKEKMLYIVRKHATRATGAVLSLWNAPIYVELVWKSIWPCWPLLNLSAKPTWSNMSERYCSLGGNIDNLAWF